MKDNWITKPIIDCIENRQKLPKAIKEKDFLQVGKFPIVSQSKELVNGYHNDERSVFRIDKPIVIFGDHTTVLKYIDFDFIIGADGIKVLKTKSNIMPKFFYYALVNLNYKTEGYKRNFSIFKNIEISYPSDLEEQQRIVEKIENFNKEYNLAKINLEKQISLSKELFANVLKEELNFENATTQPLGEIAEIKRGKSITKNKTVAGNIPVIAGGKLPAYYHNVANREGNIITVSASGANAGYLNYFEIPIYASDCSTIKSNNEKCLSTKYLYYFLKSNQEIIYQRQTGQAQPHVSPDDIFDIPISYPSDLEEQQRIVEKIENFKGFQDLLILSYTKQLQKLDSFRENYIKSIFE